MKLLTTTALWLALAAPALADDKLSVMLDWFVNPDHGPIIVAQQRGYQVKQSEVHGMAKRGGSVFSHVRYGREVWSPTIARGEVDLLIALEWAEALRWPASSSSRICAWAAAPAPPSAPPAP